MERDWKGPPGDSWTTPGEKSWPRPWWLLSIHKTHHSLFQIVNSHIYIDLHVICPWSCVWVACKVISFLWQISAATVSCSGQMSTRCLYIVKQFTYAAIYFVFFFKIIGIYSYPPTSYHPVCLSVCLSVCLCLSLFMMSSSLTDIDETFHSRSIRGCAWRRTISVKNIVTEIISTWSKILPFHVQRFSWNLNHVTVYFINTITQNLFKWADII